MKPPSWPPGTDGRCAAPSTCSRMVPGGPAQCSFLIYLRNSDLGVLINHCMAVSDCSDFISKIEMYFT